MLNRSSKPYSDYLIDPNFKGVNRNFVLLLEKVADRTVHTEYYDNLSPL